MTLLISRSMSMSSNLMRVLLHVFMVTWHFFFHRVSHLRIRHREGQDGGVKAERHAQCQDRQFETLLPALLYLVSAWLNAYALGGDLDLAMAASSRPTMYLHGRQDGPTSAKLTSSSQARYLIAR
jgi:pimeloyl-ACP methyl ester carboxylesterase